MLENSLFKQMKRVFKDETNDEKKEAWLTECRKTRLGMLWEIMFETDAKDVTLLETRIYSYGSKIKQTDYLHREIFLCLVAFLNLVIK